MEHTRTVLIFGLMSSMSFLPYSINYESNSFGLLIDTLFISLDPHYVTII